MTTGHFDKYWRAVQRKLPGVLLVAAGAAVVAWFIVHRMGPTYTVHYSYLVSLSEREETEDFRFDGYYALSATDLFTATLASWVGAPEVVVAAYEEAGVATSQDPRDVARAVTAEKKAPQLVAVTVRHKDQAVAEKLAQGLQVVMESNIEQYHGQGIPELTFRVVATNPWLGISRLSAPVIVSATFVFVLLMGVNAVLLVESVKQM